MKILRFALLAVLSGSNALAQPNSFPSSGNVMIGTVHPDFKLTVGASHTHLQLRRESTETTGGNLVFLELYQSENSPATVPEVYPSIRFHHSNRFWHRIEGRQNGIHFKDGWPLSDNYTPIYAGNASLIGRVGINTFSPEAQLDVVGSIIARGSIDIREGALRSIQTSNEGGRLELHNPQKTGATTSSWTVFNMTGPYNNGLAFWRYYADGTNAGPSVFFHDDGNVGIGTTNPTHKLAVNGTIKAKEVIVETTGWSDYVLAKNYKLLPLSEVETHINANGHLPGIPSAAQVAEQGVSVGDMQARLLAKIEELTLHQIAQEKLLKAQTSQLTAQADALKAQLAAQADELSALRAVVYRSPK
jgi:hypothetical protein